MRRALTALALLILTVAGCGGGGKEHPRPATSATSSPTTSSSSAAGPAKFAVSSPAFADNAQVPVEYSCKGRNVPPPLRWQNVPPGTESLALVVDDPDAPAGLYVHWVVTGIPPSTTEIGEGPLPGGASVSLNSSGKAEYFGPCPPAGSGVHHYRFQLYALNKPLKLVATTPAREATQTIANAAVADTRTVGLFSG
ncbi:YbhB/YbcL family Raf kinase inhibitor-like protein [Mycobacterium fragae]|uniref:YbhB/YbcL family Raf kinase inhibitor-like protein n=1 Tax=Mycobacterium fragae TaxID=1260918 RepID=UPI000A160B85|nr:YbhB/YbcL family Raf kinase inhibitor-like protein [Mycobacterium fragae]MCV7399492.1 YbhB/YbcL family Raf kinase inhibitor-like protein [Mycobacterium fragae]